MQESARPREYARDRVGRGLLALLVHAEVARDRAVSGLGLDRLAVRTQEDRGHEAERAEALRHAVRLHVAVVVLARPDEAAVHLERRGDHVVDETVLVQYLLGLEERLVLARVQLGEYVLEAAVVLLQDGVLSGQVERPLLLQRVLERAVRELAYRLVRVVHGECDAATPLEVENGEFERLGFYSGSWGPRNLELARAGHDEICGAVLIAERVATDHDGPRPAGHESRHVFANDGLAEHRAAEYVAYGAVGRLPHLLELELLDSVLVGRDRGALDAHVVLLDRLGRVHGHLVAGGVAVLDAQVEEVNVEIDIGHDELLLD